MRTGSLAFIATDSAFCSIILPEPVALPRGYPCRVVVPRIDADAIRIASTVLGVSKSDFSLKLTTTAID